jgi:hypothetical protein
MCNPWSEFESMAVYFIQSTESGNVKIGWSRLPAERLRTLQTAHAYPLKLLRMVESARHMEGRFKAYFERERIDREWFRFVPEMLTDKPRGAAWDIKLPNQPARTPIPEEDLATVEMARELLSIIFGVHITLGPSALSLSEIAWATEEVDDEINPRVARSHLLSRGLHPCRNGVWVSTNHPVIARWLVATFWSSGWYRCLLRVPGAFSGKGAVRFGTHVSKATLIPWGEIRLPNSPPRGNLAALFEASADARAD